MSGFDASYYDGRSSIARRVRIDVQPGARVRMLGDGIELTFEHDEVRVSARLGTSPRVLHLPDGAKCETTDHDAVDRAFRHRVGWLHALERRWAMTAVALVCTLAVLWAGVMYALPVLARHVAHAVPPRMEASLGEQSLQALDRHYLQPTRLLHAQRARVHAAFTRVASSLERATDLRLELRRSERLGANAFALPSGIVIMTDEMVTLAANEHEIMAVIAHEIGHVHHRHILRSILQNSAVALLLATVLGDLSSISGLAASIPTFLMEQRYSRAFEYEADAFAIQWLSTHGIDPANLAAILERLAQRGGADSEGLGVYLSTHPSTHERVQAIRGGGS